MGFDNNKSHWIDTFLKQYEKSFKKIDLPRFLNIKKKLKFTFQRGIFIKK